MLVELKRNLNTIHSELQNKLVPENLKKNVNIFTVDGAVTPGNKFSELIHYDGVRDIVLENKSTPYGFSINSDGYYESDNQGVDGSYAVCKLTFDSNGQEELNLECINYAESGCDFGIISKLDTELSLSNSTDSSTLVFRNFSSSSSANPQYVDIPLTEGTHFIYIKYKKDSSVSTHNDSFQFKILNRNYNELVNEIATIPYRSKAEMDLDLGQSDGIIGIIYNDSNEATKAYRFERGIWTLYQDIEGKAVYFKTVSQMLLDTNYPEDTNAIIIDTNEVYQATYKMVNGNWLLIGVPDDYSKSMNNLNQVDGIIEKYEGPGGTDQEIIDKLDYILNGGTYVDSGMFLTEDATISDGLPSFIGTVTDGTLDLDLGGNE